METGNLPLLAKNLFWAIRDKQLHQALSTELAALRNEQQANWSSGASSSLKAQSVEQQYSTLQKLQYFLEDYELSIRGARQFFNTTEGDQTALQLFLSRTRNALAQLYRFSAHQYLKDKLWFRQLIEKTFTEYPKGPGTGDAFPDTSEIAQELEARGIWGALAYLRREEQRKIDERNDQRKREDEALQARKAKGEELRQSIRKKLNAEEREYLQDLLRAWACAHATHEWLK